MRCVGTCGWWTRPSTCTRSTCVRSSPSSIPPSPHSSHTCRVTPPTCAPAIIDYRSILPTCLKSENRVEKRCKKVGTIWGPEGTCPGRAPDLGSGCPCPGRRATASPRPTYPSESGKNRYTTWSKKHCCGSGSGVGSPVGSDTFWIRDPGSPYPEWIWNKTSLKKFAISMYDTILLE